MGDQAGPKLWLAYSSAVLGSAFTFGWNMGVTNIPEPYIRCWIQEVHDMDQFTAAGVSCQDAATADTSDPNDALGVIVDGSTKKWALCTAILAIGAMIGSLIGGPLSDRIGRKPTMILNAVLAIATCALLGASEAINSYAAFVIGRVLIGINTGINSTVAPCYLSEIAPESKKGMFGTSFQFGVVLGIVVAQAFGLEWIFGTMDLWPYALGCGAVPALLQIVLALLSPESPKWLASNGKMAKAKIAMAQLQGKEAADNFTVEKTGDAQGLVQNIKDMVQIVGVKRALTNVLIYMIIQQFSGINACFFYSGAIFKNAGIPQTWAGVATVGLGAVNVLGVVAALFLIERAGRITLFFWSVVVMAVMCIITTIMLSFPDSEVIAYLSVIPVFLYVFFFEIGAGPIPWMMAGQYIPTEYAAGTQALGSMTNWFGVFVIGLLFPPLQSAIDQYVFVIFCVTCVLGAIYIKVYGVESKGRTIEEVQDEFTQRKSC